MTFGNLLEIFKTPKILITPRSDLVFLFPGNTSTIIGLQGALKFNGGGNINHSIFWQNLCPEKDSGQPEGALLEAINRYNVKKYIRYKVVSYNNLKILHNVLQSFHFTLGISDRYKQCKINFPRQL